MPGVRDESQTVMTVSMSKKLLSLVEAGRKKMAGINRAAFVREALAEKLGRLGFPVEEEIKRAPDRVRGVMLACSLNEDSKMTPVSEAQPIAYSKAKRKAKAKP